MSDAAGFWSYTHSDDEAEAGRIIRLAQAIRTEYELLTGGEELTIFVDREGIQWGEEWRNRIDNSLSETTFFIPIVTPRYFTRPECRKELLVFAGQAESLGVRELLLPILYVDVPGLSSESDDEAVALIARTQYESWADLRLEEETSPAYRRAVHRLASRLRDIAKAIEAMPEPPVSEVAAVSEASEEDADELGVLDSVALGEEVIPDWVDALAKLTSVMEEMHPIIEASSEAMNAAPTAAAKLIVARRFASSLDAAANRFQESNNEYFACISRIDPAMLRIIRAAIEAQAEGEDTSEYEQLFPTVMETVKSCAELAENADGLSKVLRSVGRTTRLIRPQLNKLSAGLRRIQDAQTLIDEWGRRIEASGLT